jgi:hypothetical protein
MLVYTNSYGDEMHHRKLLPLEEGEDYNEVASCTREGGTKMIRLLEREADRIGDFMAKSKSLSKLRVLYCGPKEVQQYLVGFISKLLGIPTEQAKKVIKH